MFTGVNGLENVIPNGLTVMRIGDRHDGLLGSGLGSVLERVRLDALPSVLKRGLDVASPSLWLHSMLG